MKDWDRMISTVAVCAAAVAVVWVTRKACCSGFVLLLAVPFIWCSRQG
jgi:hypothetical protein